MQLTVTNCNRLQRNVTEQAWFEHILVPSAGRRIGDPYLAFGRRCPESRFGFKMSKSSGPRGRRLQGTCGFWFGCPVVLVQYYFTGVK